jgi:DNA-binding NtrC family response regulator
MPSYLPTLRRDQKMAKILIVDDEIDLTELLSTILAVKGFEVCQAYSGFEAVELTDQNKFDLILMDIKMPGINGVEAFLRIKEKQPEAKVILMTAYFLKELIEAALNMGVYTCIFKPFDIDEMIKTITKALEKKK